MDVSVDWQALVVFPAAHRSDAASEVCGNLLPRIETVFGGA